MRGGEEGRRGQQLRRSRTGKVCWVWQLGVCGLGGAASVDGGRGPADGLAAWGAWAEAGSVSGFFE